MKYINFIQNNRKLHKSIASFLILIMMSFNAFAQFNLPVSKIDFDTSDEQFYKVISFGEKLDFGNFEDTAVWTIANEKENVIKHLKGNEINGFVFVKPGIYEIKFIENKKHIENGCNHPSFNEKTIIKVCPLKMKFDFSTIKFSEIIVGEKELDNVEASVDFYFESYNNEDLTFKNPKLIVVGIGANIIGNASYEEITLTPGKNKITYILNGKATKESYIMFDFYDINNKIQSYYYPNKL
jgi:hypothetical protein